jgi:hypothetical protein
MDAVSSMSLAGLLAPVSPFSSEEMGGAEVMVLVMSFVCQRRHFRAHDD